MAKLMMDRLICSKIIFKKIKNGKSILSQLTIVELTTRLNLLINLAMFNLVMLVLPLLI
jgi:hypothetical protein